MYNFFLSFYKFLNVPILPTLSVKLECDFRLIFATLSFFLFSFIFLKEFSNVK